MADTIFKGSSKLAIAFLLFLLANAIGALALAIAGKTPDDFVGIFFASPEDGNWAAVAFDGQRVVLQQYLISIKRGQIVGGYDGCNDWAYQEDESNQNAKRMIVTNLKECPDDTPARSYWALIAAPKIVLLNDRHLVVSGRKGRGHFSRCKRGTSRTRCMPI